MSSTRRTRVPASSLSSRKSSTTYSKGSSTLEQEPSSNVVISELLRKIESFAPHKDTFVSSLDSSKYKQLESIRETAKYLKDKKCYKLLINKIHEVYDDDIQAGTVGAFFKGSFIGESGGPCSKLAAGSFPRPATPGWKECDKNVALIQDGKFHLLNTNSSSNEMIVHIGKEETFTGFTDSVIKKMTEMGVKKTTVVPGGETDWENCISGDPESLSYAHYSENNDSEGEACDPSTKKRPHRKPEKKCDEGGWNWVVIAVIAFIVIASFIAILFWWKSRAATTPSTTTVETQVTTTHYGGPGYIHA